MEYKWIKVEEAKNGWKLEDLFRDGCQYAVSILCRVKRVLFSHPMVMKKVSGTCFASLQSEETPRICINCMWRDPGHASG